MSFLEVYQSKNFYFFHYGGNMGASLDNDVEPLVDYRFGKGAFKTFRRKGLEWGSPDYLYSLKVHKQFVKL